MIENSISVGKMIIGSLLLTSISHSANADETLIGDITIDFGGELNVATTGYGQYIVDNGTMVELVGLSIANKPGSVGDAVVTGAGTRVDLTGEVNRLYVGDEGSGTMLIADGAVVDSSGPCNTPSGCNNYVGAAGGAYGQLTVTGSGSHLSTASTFTVGVAGVFVQENDGFSIGVPGADVVAEMSVLDGASVSSNGVIISDGPGGGSPLGTENSSAIVTISGASSWSMGGLNLANADNASADLLVSSGSSLSTGGFVTGEDATSKATITVESDSEIIAGNTTLSQGAGSSTDLSVSASRFTDNGASFWILADSGNLDLTVTNGGKVSSRIMQISAQPGSSAQIRLSGEDSTLAAGPLLTLGWNFFANHIGGECTIVMTPGSVIRAANIIVGPDCKIVGRGLIEGRVFNAGKITNGIEYTAAQ